MVLDLPVEHKSSEAFLVDQTPTPTRLIENCEEVGLFEDLEHVNPFDETFRRAVESNATGATAVRPPTKPPESQECDESLHTPQVFPSNENPGEAFSNFGVEKRSLILSENLTAKQKAKSDTQENTDLARESDAEEIKTGIEEKSGETVNALPANGEDQKIPGARLLTVGLQSIVPAQILNPQSVLILPVNCQKPLIQKDNSKNDGEKRSLGKSKKEPLILPKDSEFSPEVITVRIPPKTPAAAVKSKPFILPRSDVKDTRHFNEVKVKETKSLIGLKRPAPKNTKKEEEPAKRILKDDEYMERHRAAVSRYRIRQKKEWSELRKTNASLTEENKRLLQENTKLKQLLALHQNCHLVQLIQLGTCPQNINSHLILNSGNAQATNTIANTTNNDNVSKNE